MTSYLDRRGFPFCVLFCLFFLFEKFTKGQLDLRNRIANNYPKQNRFRYNDIRQHNGNRNPAEASLQSGLHSERNNGDRFSFQKTQDREKRDMLSFPIDFQLPGVGHYYA